MRALVALLLVALALAGCSGSPEAEPQSTDDGAEAPADQPAQQGGGMHEAQMVTVTLQNNEFSPNDLTIHVGDMVHFNTMDVQQHNVVSNTPGQEFRSSDMTVANLPTMPSTYERTFEKAGDVDYVCEYHQGMTGVLHVVEHDV